MRPRRLRKVFQTRLRLSPSALGREKHEEEEKSVCGSSEGLGGFCLNRGLECFAKAACGWREARRRVSLGLCLHTAAAQKARLSSHPLPDTHNGFYLMHFALRKKKKKKLLRRKIAFYSAFGLFSHKQGFLRTDSWVLVGGVAPRCARASLRIWKLTSTRIFCNKIVQLNKKKTLKIRILQPTSSKGVCVCVCGWITVYTNDVYSWHNM